MLGPLIGKMPIHPRLRRCLWRPHGRIPLAAIPLCLTALILASCGGSGGEPCVETHDQGCVTQAEYVELADEVAGEYAERRSFQNQWGLAAIGADQAYANLELRFGPGVAAGEGVTVGVLDTGIDNGNPAFGDRIVTEQFLPGAVDEDGSEASHGTAVASILAGAEVPGYAPQPLGVAWGADLAVFALPLGSAPETYAPIAVSQLRSNAAYFAEAFKDILAWRSDSQSIDFLNLSLGVQGIVENYSEEELREPLESMIAAMVQEGSHERVVFVWAAGNDNDDPCDIPIPQCIDGAVEASSVGLYAGLAVRFPELRQNTVAVVAIRPDGEIAGFSNRCGIAAEFCLAAPGEDVKFSYFGPHPTLGPGFRTVIARGGTSFAAPMVTGGLALMKQYFRGQLSNVDLLARLLETADRSGIYAEAAIYGRGLMDLAAATSPAGAPVVAMGDRVGGFGASIQGTSLQVGRAFGDSFVHSLANREIAAFDTLGAPFWYDAASLVSAATGPSLLHRLRDLDRASARPPDASPTDPIRLPILETPGERQGAVPALYLANFGAPAATKASHLALAGRSLVATMPVGANLSATALTTEGLAGQEPASGATLAWREPDAALGVRVGWLGERETLLGSSSEGAFGDLEAHALFAGLEADTDIGQWRIGGAAEIGTVNARTHGGLFQDLSPLATSAFALHATRQGSEGDVVLVSLAQPLRVEDGEARLSVPSGRTTAGEVIRSAVALNAEPGGRQVDLAVQWQRPLDVGQLSLGASLSREPGHDRNADPELILLSGWRLAF